MTKTDPAAAIRAAQTKAAQAAAEHDQPRLARIAVLLAEIEPLAVEVSNLTGEVVTPHLVAQARLLVEGRRSLADSIATAQRAVDAVLTTEA